MKGKDWMLSWGYHLLEEVRRLPELPEHLERGIKKWIDTYKEKGQKKNE